MAIACLMSGTAQAAAARQPCYSSAEIEADQATQFQIQLMVVSGICHDPAYDQFIQRIADAIAGYQSRLIDRFRRSGSRAAERALDDYMTRLANRQGLASGQQTVGQLCEASVTLFATANGLGTPDDFRHFITSQAAANRSNYGVCKQ